MASAWQIAPPDKFSFKPEEWNKWIRRFERFREASGLADEDEEKQVKPLVYSMGDQADDIMSTLKFTNEADKEKYKIVRDKFQEHFVIRYNIPFESAKFLGRRQEDGESIDAYTTSLYVLSEHCDYGCLRERMIQDILVTGMRDTKLSEKLQLHSELTLKKAIDSARQSEAVKKQQLELRNDALEPTSSSSNAISADSMRASAKNRTSATPDKGGAETRGATSSRGSQPISESRCSRCGYSPGHPCFRCPARDAECLNCKKIGHFKAVCRAGTMNEIEVAKESAFLGVITSTRSTPPWMVKLALEGHNVNFKIDPGADVTAISEARFRMISGQRGPLRLPDKELFGPGRTKLNVAGQFTGTLTWKDAAVQDEIYVVKSLKVPLLGRPAIEALKLVARLDTLDTDAGAAEG